jgi:hypothetical protein
MKPTSMHFPISVLSALAMAMAVSSPLCAEPPILKLEYQEDAEDSNELFPKQIQTAFAKLLSTDPELAKEFKKFEAPPEQGGLGRYPGKPEVFPIILDRDQGANFQQSGGKRYFVMKVALFYRFDNGHSDGMATTSGLFALFSIDGNVTYKMTEDEKFKISGAEVIAKFEGFSRTLKVPKTAYSSYSEE